MCCCPLLVFPLTPVGSPVMSPGSSLPTPQPITTVGKCVCMHLCIHNHIIVSLCFVSATCIRTYIHMYMLLCVFAVEGDKGKSKHVLCVCVCVCVHTDVHTVYDRCACVMFDTGLHPPHPTPPPPHPHPTPTPHAPHVQIPMQSQ